MSDFRFAKSWQPGAMVATVGFGAVALVACVGLWAASASMARQADIAEMQGLIARAAQIERTGETTGGLTDEAFLVGDTPQLAQAVLQTNLQSLADSFDISVDVIRTDQIEQIDGYVRLNLTINGSAPEAQLGGFLHGLAAMEPIVVAQEMTLRPARATRTNPDRRVSFQVQLYGLAAR